MDFISSLSELEIDNRQLAGAVVIHITLYDGKSRSTLVIYLPLYVHAWTPSSKVAERTSQRMSSQ